MVWAGSVGSVGSGCGFEGDFVAEGLELSDVVSFFGVGLLRSQHGRCAICGGFLLHADHQPTSPDEWEQWLKATAKAISIHVVAVAGVGPPEIVEPRLIHTSCRRRESADSAALLPARKLTRPA